MTTLPPGIGPHEGRELELLLTGSKPIARFRLGGLAEDEQAFEAAVARGDILQFDVPSSEPHLHRRYYCLRGEEWRVKLMELIEYHLENGNESRFTEEDLHRMDGALLGYTKPDIDLFIERLRARRDL